MNAPQTTAFVLTGQPNDYMEFNIAPGQHPELVRKWEGLTSRMESAVCESIRSAQDHAYQLGKEEGEAMIKRLSDSLLALLKADADDNMEEIDHAIAALKAVGVDVSEIEAVSA